MRNDEDVVLERIRLWSCEIQHVGDGPKSSKRFALEAVKYSEEAISCFSPDIQDDDEVVQAAIENNVQSFRNLTERHRDNIDLVRYVTYRDPFLILDATPRIQMLPEFAQMFREQNGILQRNLQLWAARQ